MNTPRPFPFPVSVDLPPPPYYVSGAVWWDRSPDETDPTGGPGAPAGFSHDREEGQVRAWRASLGSDYADWCEAAPGSEDAEEPVNVGC